MLPATVRPTPDELRGVVVECHGEAIVVGDSNFATDETYRAARSHGVNLGTVRAKR